MSNQTKDWNIDDIVSAVIADDPDAEEIRQSLTQALAEIKNDQYARKTKVFVSPVAQTRHKLGLSQNKFAQQIGISVNTLKSWEQGVRNPSGAALKLIQLLDKRPELISELEA